MAFEEESGQYIEAFMDEAVEPVIMALAKVVIERAEALTAEFANASNVSEEAAAHLQSHNLHTHFMDSMEKAKGTSVADEVEKFLKLQGTTPRFLPMVKPTYGVTYLSPNEHYALDALDQPGHPQIDGVETKERPTYKPVSEVENDFFGDN